MMNKYKDKEWVAKELAPMVRNILNQVFNGKYIKILQRFYRVCYGFRVDKSILSYYFSTAHIV